MQACRSHSQTQNTLCHDGLKPVQFIPYCTTDVQCNLRQYIHPRKNEVRHKVCIKYFPALTICCVSTPSSCEVHVILHHRCTTQSPVRYTKGPPPPHLLLTTTMMRVTESVSIDQAFPQLSESLQTPRRQSISHNAQSQKGIAHIRSIQLEPWICLWRLILVPDRQLKSPREGPENRTHPLAEPLVSKCSNDFPKPIASR